MILFQEDWARDRAVLHDETNNKTFIRIAMVLKRLGVANYAFPLALHQADLAKHNPHHLTDPSEELRLRIALECKINPWYYFREVARVPATGGDTVPLNANRAVIAMIWSFMNHISYIAIQPRQTGKTISACSIVTWVMWIAGYNIEVTLYTKDNKLVQANVARIKTMRDALPPYLIFPTNKDTDNKEGLSYTKLLNRYMTAIAPSSKQDADNLARGMTSSVIHGDEPGFCDNIDISYPVMMFSTLTAVRNARERGQPHSNLWTTTAAPTDTTRGRFAFNMVNRAMPFAESLYDVKDRDALQHIVDANSANGMVNGTFSYLMLGYDRSWYENAVRISEAPQDVNDRELLNIWSSGTELSILDPALIQLINANRREPDHVEIIDDYAVKWYVTENFRNSAEFFQRRYILGMDSSENIGEDFTTLVMIDVADMGVACTFRCNESNTIKIGLFIAAFLMKYSNVTFIPERNSTGGAIIDVITMVFQTNRINPFRRIFNQIVQKRNEDENMAKISIDSPDAADTTVKKHLGFRTDGKTRGYLYRNTLKKAVGMNATRIFDNILVSELSALSVENGRIDHKEGGHDDTVIAYLLCCWLIFFGENLHYYGIDVRLILMSVTSDGMIVDPAYRDQQLALRRNIKHYEELFDSAQSPVMKNTYRQKIMFLQSHIDPSISVEPIGVATIGHDVKEYGDMIYTPQEFARQSRKSNDIDVTLRQLMKWIR